MSDTISRDEPVRTALIGYGHAGSVFHAPIVASTDGMALTSVVTRNAARAAAALDRYPNVRIVPTVEDLLLDPQDIDLVVVASPNNTHLPVGLSVLEAGLPVVIDKPVAASAAARQLRDAAAAKDLMISVYHNRRWDGDYRTLRKLFAQGVLGTVHRFESRYERWRPQVNAAAWREQAGPETAGGLLYDLGSHLIDQALVLFGPVTSVYAEIGKVRPGAQVDDDVFLSLTHVSGVRSHLWASSIAANFGPRFRVLGSAGSYLKYGMDVQEDELRRGDTSRQPNWGVELEASWGELGTPGDTRKIPTEPGAYPDYYASVRDALRGKLPPPVTIEQAIDVLVVIEAAQRNAREASPVPIDI
jgi:scyllo-inositol 2-dehydrogenase (NADP+)